MKLFRIGIVVAVILLCIPRKVQAFENTFCSFHYNNGYKIYTLHSTTRKGSK